MVDPTTLNPTETIDQFTAFALLPVCVRCGCGGFDQRKDRSWRCQGCHRAVVHVEYAPTIYSQRPTRVVRTVFK